MINETVDSLAARVGGRVVGDGTRRIRGVADLVNAGPEDVGFVRDVAFVDVAERGQAGAVVVSEPLELSAAQIVVGDVATAFAMIAAVFHRVRHAEVHAVHPTAFVDPSATLEEPVEIGPQASIGAGVRIGAGTTVAAGVVVEEGAQIGEDCSILARVVLGARCRLGDRVMVQPGAVVGSDGFGYARDGVRWVKVPQVGDVVIGDDAEIGANVTVDRGTFGSTVIGSGVKVDNLVHIGHNCVIGENTAIAALSGFAGSTRIGARCIFGGHVVTKGHMAICDDVRIGGGSAVTHDVAAPGDYMGYPIMGKRRWVRTLSALERLADERTRSRDS